MKPARWMRASAGGLLLALVACGQERAPEVDHGQEAARQRVLAFWEHFRSATARRTERDCAGAIPLYREALELDPRHEDSLYYLGQCLRQERQPQAARTAFERLVEVNPRSSRGHLALGALLASPDAAEPFDLPEAERHFRRAHELNGEETGPMVRLGEVLILLGRPKEARHWLESAARTNPKSVEAALLASYLASRAGEPRAARRLFEGATDATRIAAPAGGVPGEGDRRLRGAGGRAAAPPLENPLGRLLFAEAAHVLREAGSAELENGAVLREAAWRAVDGARRQYLRRHESAG